MSIACVIVIYHFPDLCGVMPKVAEPFRVVVCISIMLVNLVSEPSGKEGETLSNVLRFWMHKGIRRDHSELHPIHRTANPAAGNAYRLRFYSLLFIT